jgi:hypothetical protein
MRIIPLFSLLFLAQTWPCAQTFDQASMQLQFMNHYGQVSRKGASQVQRQGSETLYDDWKPMKILTKEDTIYFSAVKINLWNSFLEVLYEGEEKVVLPRNFNYVEAIIDGKTKRFYPGGNFKVDGAALPGYVEILGEGEEKVLINHYLAIKPPNPNAHIVGGLTEDKLIKTSDNYIQKGSQITPLRNKKELSAYFKNDKAKLKKLMAEQKLDIKDPYQLSQLLALMRS